MQQICCIKQTYYKNLILRFLDIKLIETSKIIKNLELTGFNNVK